MDIDLFTTQCLSQSVRPSPRELGRQHAIADFRANTSNTVAPGSSLPRLHTKTRSLTIAALLNSTQSHPGTPTVSAGVQAGNRLNSVYTKPSIGFGLPESVPCSARSHDNGLGIQPSTPLGNAPWADTYFLNTSLLVLEGVPVPAQVSEIAPNGDLTPRESIDTTHPSTNIRISVPSVDVTEDTMDTASHIDTPALYKPPHKIVVSTEDSDPAEREPSTRSWADDVESHSPEDPMDLQAGKSLPATPPRAPTVSVPFGTPGHQETSAFAQTNDTVPNAMSEDDSGVEEEPLWNSVPGGGDPSDAQFAYLPTAKLTAVQDAHYTTNTGSCEPSRGMCSSSLKHPLKFPLLPNSCTDSPIASINNRTVLSLLNTESV